MSIQPKNHPFRFLLYLEWGLLAIALISEILPPTVPRLPKPPHHGDLLLFPLVPPLPNPVLLSVLSLVGFGFMGLRLPTGKLSHRVAFTMAEIGLILLGTMTKTPNLGGLRLFPFLYVVLVIRSCLMFRLPGRLVVTGVSFTLFLLMLVRRVQDLGFPVPLVVRQRFRPVLFGFATNSVLLLGLVLVFVLLLMNALLTERESREKLAIANTQLRNYALRIETLAASQERNRIARDIHDSLGHSLTALNIQLETAVKLAQSDPPRSQRFLQEAKRLGSTALQDVRQSVAAMRSDPWQQRSLEEAIAALVHTVQRTTEIQPTVHINLATPLSPEINTSLYRIVQEALTNICKHAQATQIEIHLRSTLTDLRLSIQDNGNGFDVTQNQTGFGLQSMRDRTLALGGTFEVASAPTQGCWITVRIPL